MNSGEYRDSQLHRTLRISNWVSGSKWTLISSPLRLSSYNLYRGRLEVWLRRGFRSLTRVWSRSEEWVLATCDWVHVAISICWNICLKTLSIKKLGVPLPTRFFYCSYQCAPSGPGAGFLHAILCTPNCFSSQEVPLAIDSHSPKENHLPFLEGRQKWIVGARDWILQGIPILL